jgi:hypothetical protein
MVVAVMMMAAAIKATRKTVSNQPCGGGAKNGGAGFHDRARAAVLIIDGATTDTHRDHGDGQDETLKDGFHAR